MQRPCSRFAFETIVVSEEKKFPELAFTLGRASDDKTMILIVMKQKLAFWLYFSSTNNYSRRLEISGAHSYERAGKWPFE